ncbi:hypothetical protein [Nocardiopsis sp. FR26]|uniref:hypothetical protein n=1 Tax=Nocardiopsis sp. FR26 TaxID=2605987 RepID=UPI00135AC9AA|nr:hypothetical protein [Nocardiopsis sp. FR26]
MTGIERPTTLDGTEYDFFSPASRRYMSKKAGVASGVKRKARRRDRHNRKAAARAYRLGRADW